MALFGKSTKQKDESKKPAEKAATKSAKVTKSKAPAKAKKAKLEAPAVVSPAVVKTPPVAVTPGAAVTAHFVILAPHITEKANLQNEKHNVYTFKVAETATKHNVAHAIKKDFKVTPTDVRFVSMPGKTIVYRGRYAYKAGFKKAYVSLKKGDKIDFGA